MTNDSPTEFVVDLENLGQFVFAKRNMRSEIRTKVELRRLTEGVTLDELTMLFLVALADLKVLTLSAPTGWGALELDNLDPYDQDDYTNVLRIWEELRKKEEPFRRVGAPLPKGGEGTGGELRDGVPAGLQPGADGPAVS